MPRMPDKNRQGGSSSCAGFGVQFDYCSPKRQKVSVCREGVVYFM